MLGKSFNRKKETKQPSSQPASNRLSAVYSLPTIRDMRVLLGEAEKTRGLLCELPIEIGSAKYLLSCQSDHLSKEPCWTLYEGDGSKQLWSYLNENLEMIEGIVCMSVSEKKAPTAAQTEQWQPTEPAASAASSSQPEQLPAPVPPINAQPCDPYAGWGAAAQQPATAPAAQPAWNQMPAAADGFASHAAAANHPAYLAEFAHRLQAKKDSTMAELSMDPALPPSCIDAALKLQEMVLKGHFNDKVAFQAFKLAVLNNGLLDDSVLAKAKANAASDPEDLARQAARLLQQAGLLAEQDLLAAQKNMPEQDNSFLKAIAASGKVDKLLLEVAQDCLPLIADGRLRSDQAIIALHYCARSRSKLKDALADLSINID